MEVHPGQCHALEAGPIVDRGACTALTSGLVEGVHDLGQCHTRAIGSVRGTGQFQSTTFFRSPTIAAHALEAGPIWDRDACAALTSGLEGNANRWGSVPRTLDRPRAWHWSHPIHPLLALTDQCHARGRKPARSRIGPRARH